MRTMCSREIFTEKYRQQQIFDSDLKGAWHYNHVTFSPIAKNCMLYCRLIYMLSMLYVRLAIKVKVGIPESFKVGWYPHKITGSSHLNLEKLASKSCTQTSQGKMPCGTKPSLILRNYTLRPHMHFRLRSLDQKCSLCLSINFSISRMGWRYDTDGKKFQSVVI